MINTLYSIVLNRRIAHGSGHRIGSRARAVSTSVKIKLDRRFGRDAFTEIAMKQPKRMKVA